MESTIKQKWVKALRSGKYKQGRGMLRNNDNEFCCLGVLCDLFDQSRWIKRENGYSYKYGKGLSKGYASSNLPEDIFKKIGLSWYQEDILINMNDNRRMSFDEIADWIEERVTDE